MTSSFVVCSVTFFAFVCYDGTLVTMKYPHPSLLWILPLLLFSPPTVALLTTRATTSSGSSCNCSSLLNHFLQVFFCRKKSRRYLIIINRQLFVLSFQLLGDPVLDLNSTICTSRRLRSPWSVQNRSSFARLVLDSVPRVAID
jgi:hypothetical protein